LRNQSSITLSQAERIIAKPRRRPAQGHAHLRVINILSARALFLGSHPFSA
jgi:hypothetical protein